jgi:3',5'-cyclic AMP phosphodiesterase CpdA
MRILHISDLHASADKDVGQQRVADALVRDIREANSVIPVDLIVFSGDLADEGSEAELLLGHELVIEPVLAALGQSFDRLIMVPGNHDVARELINPYEEDGLRSKLDTEQAVTELLSNSESVARADARLRPWFDYLQVLEQERRTVGGLATVYRFDVRGRTVGAVGLNSAWRSAGSGDERHLLVGGYQLASALAQIRDCDLVLVVVHHPLDWLDRFDEAAVRRELDRHDVLLFCGHLHEPEPSDEIRRGHTIYSRAGCLYEHETFHNGYSLVDINSDGTITISMRTWWPDRGVFDQATNITQDGVFTAAWPSRNLASSMLPPQGDVLASLADIVQLSSLLDDSIDSVPNPLLEDLLVEPRLLPLPYRDALAAKRVEDELDVRPVQPWRASWLETSVVLVAGPPEAGVSSSLLWLLAERYKDRSDLLPVYVPFDNRFSARNLERTLEVAARQSGWTGQRQDLPPMIVAFDDVVALGRGLETTLTYLKEHPEHRALFGCREDEHDSLAQRLTAIPTDYESVFLAPFGRQQLRTLVEKVAGSGSHDVIDVVFSVVDEQDLPRTPFILTALVAVVRTVNPSDLSKLTASELLQSFASLLLGRDDIKGTDHLGMDHRSREYLLGSYAEELALKGTDSMTRRDAEEFVAGWFKTKGWGPGTSPGRVLDSLIARKILLEDSAKSVGFRQPALKYLFTAKWMLESDKFRDVVLRAPLAYPDALCHAASLQRSSKALLTATHDAARKLVEAHLTDLALFDAVSNQSGWSAVQPQISDLERVASEDSPEVDEPDQHEVDARLDEIYDRHIASEDGGSGPTLTLQHGELAHAMWVLTSVLRSSELVDDVDLKKMVLRTAIQGWGLLAAYASSSGEATALREYLSNEDHEETGDEEELERMMRLMIVVAMLLEVEEQLGTIHLAKVVDDMLCDGELMDESASALFMTLLYFVGHRGQAVEQMRELFEAHRDHAIIVSVVRAWAHWAYELEERVDTRSRLENLLVDIYIGSNPARRGQERAHQRDGIASSLRSLRLKRLARRQRLGRTGLDELDAAAPEAQPAERVAQSK